MKDVIFHCFPKPKTRLDDCKEWIKRCGRPHEQLNVEKINPNTYVCSKVCTYFILYLQIYITDKAKDMVDGWDYEFLSIDV